MKTTKTSSALPATFVSTAAGIEREIDKLSKLISASQDFARRAEHERFVKAGGCPKCNGRGSIVRWDTMDCMDGSYAEFAPCPNCTAEQCALTGLDRSYSDKYDKWMGHYNLTEGLPMLAETTAPLREQVSTMRARVEDLRRKAIVKKGDEVVVVKGRKVPVGVVGRVFWFGDSEWGTKLGIETAKGETHWTYLANVEKLLVQ